MTAETPPSLEDLRREIDRLDEAMHALLIERGAIIDRLIAVKGTHASGAAFRPGREAAMMRRLVARHTGRLPVATIEHIWRTIISTFTHVQAPHRVHVDARGGSGLHDLARFQMGFEVPLVRHEDAAAVVEAVASSAGDLGLVGLGRVAAPWWDALGGDGGPQIMARLPFVLDGRRAPLPPAFVIANPLGDAAVDEVAVVAVARPARPDAAVLGGAEIVAEAEGGGRWRALLALEGSRLSGAGRGVGGYARPVGMSGSTTGSAG